MNPLVSIICIAYNQEKYIAHTLDSFLMQKVSFKYEVIIHDDASTDKTGEIIKEYDKHNPGVFKLMFEKENQFSKSGVKFINNMFHSAKGKYIALCEGDDYWIDPKKLQKQVDFLEKHQDHSICFHPVKIILEGSKKIQYFPEQTNPTFFTLSNLLRSNFIQTNSVMYRSQKYSNLECDVLPNDWYLHLYHARYGKIGFLKEPMSVYLRNSTGVWRDRESQKKSFWKKYWLSHVILYIKLLNLFKSDKESVEIINSSLGEVFSDALQYSDISNRMIEVVMKEYPGFSEVLMKSLATKITAQNMLIESLKKDNLRLEKKNQASIYQIERLEFGYNGVVNSLSWKVTKPLRSTKASVKKLHPKK